MIVLLYLLSRFMVPLQKLLYKKTRLTLMYGVESESKITKFLLYSQIIHKL